jgi:hypothetical protein
MGFFKASAVALLIAGLSSGAERVWNFENDEVNEPARGLLGEEGTWRVVAVPGGGKVLAQTAQSPDTTFNVALAEQTQAKDLVLSVRIKAVAGKLDQGGGLIWRARDRENYYIARFNPLEDNFRVYKVVDGKRTQLQSADIKHGNDWFTIRVTMVGDHIECEYNGKKYLDVRDTTFPNAGKVGLWSKADAQSYFDDVRLEER